MRGVSTRRVPRARPSLSPMTCANPGCTQRVLLDAVAIAVVLIRHTAHAQQTVGAIPYIPVYAIISQVAVGIVDERVRAIVGHLVGGVVGAAFQAVILIFGQAAV